MKAKMRRNIGRVILLLCVCAARPTLAAVIDLREQVRQHPSLIHHYTFHNDALRDSKGDLHLTAWSSYSPSVLYGAGADPLSWAGTALEGASDYKGAAWHTTDTVTLPRSLTVECVLRPNTLIKDNGYVVAARDAAARERRAYFLRINSDGYFNIEIGASTAFTFYDKLETNHWYYVVATFAVDNDNYTTVNTYVADLTAGGSLKHAVSDRLIEDYYTVNPTRLGIGAMYNETTLSHISPASLDEVALYDAVLDMETVTQHWDALQRATPELVYREIFPSDDNTNSKKLDTAGWFCNYNFTAKPTTEALIQGAATAFDEDIAPVASFPTSTGVARGYLNLYNLTTATNFIYWTEEMTNRVEFAWLSAITFDARFNTAQPGRVALRLDVNGTPQNTDDDTWYVAWDFANPAGTSAPEIQSMWWRYLLDMTVAEWTTLNFQPGVVLELGQEQVYPPEQAVITGFGLFHPIHIQKKNERLDNYTLYMRQIFPPSGTVIQVN